MVIWEAPWRRRVLSRAQQDQQGEARGAQGEPGTPGRAVTDPGKSHWKALEATALSDSSLYAWRNGGPGSGRDLPTVRLGQGTGRPGTQVPHAAPKWAGRTSVPGPCTLFLPLCRPQVPWRSGRPSPSTPAAIPAWPATLQAWPASTRRSLCKVRSPGPPVQTARTLGAGERVES